MKNKLNTFYISTDGILEPLGYSQVLKYVIKLSNDYKITLFTLEKKNELKNIKKLNYLKNFCSKNNIDWKQYTYSSNLYFFSYLINTFKIIFINFYLFLIKKPLLIHIRSYMPGLIIPFLSFFFKFKLVFDMRGFWADEKVDRLGWKKNSIKYIFFKILEKYLLLRSDHIISLTYAAKNYLSKSFKIKLDKISVIRTCVDLKYFSYNSNSKSLIKLKQKLSKKITIGYLGSADTAYDFEKFIFFTNKISKMFNNFKIHIIVLSKTDRSKILNYITASLKPNITYSVLYLEKEKLIQKILTFNLMVFFLKKRFSLKASMPTKVGESLACGVPFVCNGFNPDIKFFCKKYNIGYIYDFNQILKKNKIEKFIFLKKTNRKSIYNFVQKHFSLKVGYLSYLKIYKNLLKY